jgi:hypothetical protein
MRFFLPLSVVLRFLPLGVEALFETAFHSSSVVVQPFTILERSPLYDPEDTNLFLVCPNGGAVAQPGPAIYKSSGELVWADSSIGNCFDFNIQTYDGQQYLTLWMGAEGQQMGFGTVIMLNSRAQTSTNSTSSNPRIRRPSSRPSIRFRCVCRISIPLVHF